MADVRGAVESLPDECSTSTSSAHVTEASYEPSTEVVLRLLFDDEWSWL